MATEIKDTEYASEHPIEEFLNIDSGSTMVHTTERITELAVSADYDAKDDEIEQQFQEVYDVAMDAFDKSTQATENIDTRFKARNDEVAVQYLNAALNAATAKANLKNNKEKIKLAQNKISGSGTVNNNLIVADRNELLKQLMQQSEDNNNEGEVIDAEET